MASSRPPARNFAYREADGFLDRAVQLVGSAEEWDEISLNFAPLLCNAPDYGEVVVGDLRAISLLTDPPLTVYYRVIEHERAVEMLTVEPV
jgi:hypothetical protein